MLTNSREIRSRLEREGWILVRNQGLAPYISQFKDRCDNFSAASKKGFGRRLGQKNLPGRELVKRLNGRMTHYIAIVEEEEGKAIGVWFPDLPGCISAGDTLDEVMLNAAEARELWAGAMIESGQ